MIKKFLSSLILVLAVVIGVSAADYVRNKSAQNEPNGLKNSISIKMKKSGKQKSKKPKNNNHKKEAKGEKDKSASDAITYMKFKRQFVVPVMGNGKINSLVILNLNLELNSSAPTSLYTLEPKLRDAFMRELLSLSHEGVFSNDLTSPETYEKLRTTLLLASQDVIKEGVNNVLILDLVRQDQ